MVPVLALTQVSHMCLRAGCISLLHVTVTGHRTLELLPYTIFKQLPVQGSIPCSANNLTKAQASYEHSMTMAFGNHTTTFVPGAGQGDHECHHKEVPQEARATPALSTHVLAAHRDKRRGAAAVPCKGSGGCALGRESQDIGACY